MVNNGQLDQLAINFCVKYSYIIETLKNRISLFNISILNISRTCVDSSVSCKQTHKTDRPTNAATCIKMSFLLQFTDIHLSAAICCFHVNNINRSLKKYIQESMTLPLQQQRRPRLYFIG